MIENLLINKFIGKDANISSRAIRDKYGYLGGIVGIITNLILVIIKISVGLFIGSIAVIADGINNLSDIASSLITIIGFKLSSKPADKDHPFGHGRIEYISALIVAFLVLVVGFEFAKSSIEKIKAPTPVIFSWFAFWLLSISILFKVWLSKFYKSMGEKINSSALKASSLDSISDAFSSLTVVISILAAKFTTFPIDGYMGFVVSLIIMYAGFSLIKETLDPLLGNKPDDALVEDINRMLMSYEHIGGTHDLMVHNYGPGRIIATIHAEIPEDISIVAAHEIIDRAEKEISTQLNINLLIHMDPINTNDKEVIKDRDFISVLLEDFKCIQSFHDFRVVGEKDCKNLIFDVVVTDDFEVTKESVLKLQKDINAKLKIIHPKYNAIITVDSYYC